MLRPERMTSASIICVRQDVETVLAALNNFGEFHIEQAAEDATVSEYSQNIQKIEESLSNVNELIKQLSQEKSGFLDIFKITIPPKTQVTAENWQALSEYTSQQILVLKKEVDDFNTSLCSLQEKTSQLNHIKDVFIIMDKMEVDLVALKEAKLIHLTVASVPHKNFNTLQTALASFPLILNRTSLTKEADFVCLAVPCKHGSDVDKILKAHRAEIFAIPADLPNNAADALNEVNNQLKDNSHKEKAVADSLSKLGRENRYNLASWKETIENILALLNAKKKILQSGHLATVEGFVPKKKFAALTEKVHTMLGEKAIVLQKTPQENADPPTSLSNNRFVKPFEELTKLYGLPHYNELDPTPFMALSFPILFGLMFGDFGHGLILFAGGLGIYLMLKKSSGIKNMAWIITMCGVAAMAAGLLYGEFFGQPIHSVLGFGGPIWFDPFIPTSNIFQFLIFALYIGVAQIMLGVVLEMVDFVLAHKASDAILLSLPKIAFYAGAVFVISVYKLNITSWFPGPVMIIVVPFILMVVAKPVYVAMGNMSIMGSVGAQGGEELAEAHEGSIGQSIFESGDLVIRLLSNSVSYSRILALLTAHWALLLVTYSLAALIGTAIGGIAGLVVTAIVIVGGNIFVIALEGLIVFIHTLRLHFYEWFSKFYKGTGTEFNPFKQKFVYTEVTLKEKEV